MVDLSKVQEYSVAFVTCPNNEVAQKVTTAILEAKLAGKLLLLD